MVDFQSYDPVGFECQISCLSVFEIHLFALVSWQGKRLLEISLGGSFANQLVCSWLNNCKQPAYG